MFKQKLKKLVGSGDNENRLGMTNEEYLNFFFFFMKIQSLDTDLPISSAPLQKLTLMEVKSHLQRLGREHVA